MGLGPRGSDAFVGLLFDKPDQYNVSRFQFRARTTYNCTYDPFSIGHIAYRPTGISAPQTV